MLYLKQANLDDIEKEYQYITQLPKDEHGFMNDDYGCTKQQFIDEILPKYMDYANGVNLPEGYVPSTKYFLWDEDEIVGLFNFRHYCNEYLKNGAGHIGFGIHKDYRGRGYGTKGLTLLIELIKDRIQEDEIYMSFDKDNIASLKTQMKCGAYIHHESDTQYFTRILIK